MDDKARMELAVKTYAAFAHGMTGLGAKGGFGKHRIGERNEIRRPRPTSMSVSAGRLGLETEREANDGYAMPALRG